MNGFENYTPLARRVLANANREAQQLCHPYVGTEHLLLGLASLREGVAADVLASFGVTADAVRDEIKKVVEMGEAGADVDGLLPYTPRSKKVFLLAQTEAHQLGQDYIGTEHLLLALLREGEGIAANVLEKLGITLGPAIEAVKKALDLAEELGDGAEEGDGGEEMPDGEESPRDRPEPPRHEKSREMESVGAGGRPGSTRGNRTPALDAFGRDLTALARNGSLDPVIGRAKELERVIQILCRRTKNNAALLGEAGVGKTAVVEGLAQAIAAGEVPELLLNRRVVALDMTRMVAGTKYRGQFEERIKGVMDEVKRLKNVILFMDEIHNIVGAGGAEGAMDAANIIKPALARGEMQCIGATTLDEYHKYIEKDAALERRFQPVRVEEPSIEGTVGILKGIRPTYEAFHHVKYDDAALVAAAKLTARYQPGRYLPDKAIDAIDETGARARILGMKRPDGIRELERRLAKTTAEKNAAIAAQEFGEAAELRDRELAEQKELDQLRDDWKAGLAESIGTVTADDVAETLSRTTGVPIQKADDDELQRYLALEDEMRRRVVGQDEAIRVVARALRRSRADLKDPKRPIGTFIFLGPTGVGKTLFAKTLAESVFGDAKALIQLDMSEYMEKYSASRLVGAPPGYVGFEEGGQLTERVRRRPYSVVLFDEIEKASPEVVHMLLQILEEGHLTDGQGRKVDFRNTVIILTSNLGAAAANGGVGSVGFGDGSTTGQSALQQRILAVAKRTFRPELLNRFDDIIVFRQLEREDFEKILGIETAAIRSRLEAKGITLEMTPEAVDFLLSKGSDKSLGARPLRRAVEHYVEDPLAEALLRKDFAAPCTVRAVKGGDDALEFKTAE